MPFLLNLIAGCLAAFGLSVLFGSLVVWLENRDTHARSAAPERLSAVHSHARPLLSSRDRVSRYRTMSREDDQDRNVA